jgi:sugar phosphate isomerase/epimerase
VASKFDADSVGICVSTLHPDPHSFVRGDVERLSRAAARAGFPSLALQIHWVTTYGVSETRSLLNETGLTAGALEGAMNWASGLTGADEDAARLLDVAAAIGAPVLHAACMAPQLDSVARAVDGFAALCERARACNVKVSIEFIPWYAIPDLDTAWRIVREAAADNGGICLDLMHWACQPGGADTDRLRKIPGSHISYVQLTDSPRSVARSADDYLAECMESRPMPGAGVVKVAKMLEAVAATGADPYFAYQVCNPQLARTGADSMAAQLRANAAILFPGRSRERLG